MNKILSVCPWCKLFHHFAFELDPIIGNDSSCHSSHGPDSRRSPAARCLSCRGYPEWNWDNLIRRVVFFRRTFIMATRADKSGLNKEMHDRVCWHTAGIGDGWAWFSGTSRCRFVGDAGGPLGDGLSVIINYEGIPVFMTLLRWRDHGPFSKIPVLMTLFHIHWW